MPNQPLGCREQIIETDAEPNLLDHLVRVFGIDVVFYCLTCFFVEVFRVYLDKVRNFGLEIVRYSLEIEYVFGTYQDEHDGLCSFTFSPE